MHSLRVEIGDFLRLAEKLLGAARKIVAGCDAESGQEKEQPSEEQPDSPEGAHALPGTA